MIIETKICVNIYSLFFFKYIFSMVLTRSKTIPGPRDVYGNMKYGAPWKILSRIVRQIKYICGGARYGGHCGHQSRAAIGNIDYWQKRAAILRASAIARA